MHELLLIERDEQSEGTRSESPGENTEVKIEPERRQYDDEKVGERDGAGQDMQRTVEATHHEHGHGRHRDIEGGAEIGTNCDALFAVAQTLAQKSAREPRDHDPAAHYQQHVASSRMHSSVEAIRALVNEPHNQDRGETPAEDHRAPLLADQRLALQLAAETFIGKGGRAHPAEVSEPGLWGISPTAIHRRVTSNVSSVRPWPVFQCGR